MKRVLLLFLAAIVAVLAINACEKLPDGTGILKVEVSVFYYENNGLTCKVPCLSYPKIL